MENLPPAGFHFAADDYGPVDFPSSLQSDMQAGMGFAAGGPVFPQNQRISSYGVSPFHMNYSQQATMAAAVSGLPSSSFRSRFSDYASDQGPHNPMPVPSPASAMISDRLPSFSTIVSSGGSSNDIGKSSQALYSGQQHAFQSPGSRSLQSRFASYPDQVSGKNYSKSPSLGSTSPGMSSNSYSNSISHSAILQHSTPNGSSQHMSALSPRSFKEETQNPQYLPGGMHLDRHSIYGHPGIAQNPGESMTLPKFKHKYHNQHIPKHSIGPVKFYIIGRTERLSVFNKGTQTKDEPVGELKIKIPKTELYRESDNDFSDDDGSGRMNQVMPGATGHGAPKESPRITFPYDPLPSHGGEYNYNKNAKVKTVISPSFMDSAGKATMTTCVSNKATIVTVGIVSRPANLSGAEPTGSTYQKGIMATGIAGSRVPYKHQNSRLSIGSQDSEDQNLENYEQLMEERKAKARDLEQERMEVSVRIDDTQFVQVGTSKRWQCNECDKSYTTKHNLVMHVLDHSGIKPHLCLKCGKYFKQLSHLNTHMLTHDKIKPHTCNLCGKGFTQISHLKRHTAVSEKNGYCATLRSKHLLSNSPSSSQLGGPGEHHLKAHQFTHTGLKPYACDICERAFNQKANLQRHKLIHDNTRTFKCHICGKTFTQPQTLKAHQVVHADHKPFECNICGKEFGRYHNLQGHMHMHTNSKPYVCFCGSTFTLKGNLNRHKKVKHGLNETTDVMEEDAVNFLSSLSERARDEHNAEGETESLSPGSGAEGPDGKSGRKGRKSIPRKITQGEGEEATYSQPAAAAGDGGSGDNARRMGSVQPDGTLKPFVIQNPDTDEEMDDTEEEGEVTNPSTFPKAVRPSHDNATPVTNVVNFQPLNNNGSCDPESASQPLKRIQSDESAEAEKRPRRQSQRRSPKVNSTDVQQFESDEENGDYDNTDTDWVPGSRRRSRGKGEAADKKS